MTDEQKEVETDASHQQHGESERTEIKADKIEVNVNENDDESSD